MPDEPTTQRQVVNLPRLTAADRAAVVVALLLPTAVTWLYFVALDGAAPWLQKGAYGLGKTIQFALPLAWVCLVQRQRLKISSPGSRGLALGAAFGMAVGGALIALYFFVLRPAGSFDEPARAVRAKVDSLGIGTPAAYLAVACFYSAIHSLLEEYYWRWFAFGQLARWFSPSAAIAVSGLAFAAHHVLVLAHFFSWASPWTWLGTASVAIGGACWAWLYRHSGSLYAPWLSHAFVDAAIFTVGYSLLAA